MMPASAVAPFHLLSGFWRTSGNPGLWSFDTTSGEHSFDGSHFGRDFDITHFRPEGRAARFFRGDGWSTTVSYGSETSTLTWLKDGEEDVSWDKVHTPFASVAGRWQTKGAAGIWTFEASSGRHTYDGAYHGPDFDLTYTGLDESGLERIARRDGWSALLGPDAKELNWERPGEEPMLWLRVQEAVAVAVAVPVTAETPR